MQLPQFRRRDKIFTWTATTDNEQNTAALSKLYAGGERANATKIQFELNEIAAKWKQKQKTAENWENFKKYLKRV